MNEYTEYAEKPKKVGTVDEGILTFIIIEREKGKNEY